MPASESGAYGRPGPVGSPAAQAAASAAPAAPTNPYRAANRENAAAGDAGQYAGQAFDRWWSGLAPAEAAKFAGPDPNHENAAGIQKQNARQHFLTNLLPQDQQYQQLQGTQRTARDARIAGSGVEDFQRDQASATGARNSANAIATDATARSTLAQGEADEAKGRGDLSRSQATTLLPAQARNLDAGTAATATDSRIKGAQWDAQSPLYPKQLEATIGQTQADTGLKNAQADAARAGGTAAVVGAYGTANRPTVTKNDAGDPVAVPPSFTYGPPAGGSLLPSITPTAAPTTPSTPAAPAPAAPGAAPGVQSAATPTPAAPAAPATPTLPQRAAGAMQAVNSSLQSPWSLLGPVAAGPRAIKAGIEGFTNPGGTQSAAAAAKTLTINGVTLTQQADGSYAGSNGKKYRIGPDGKFSIAG